MSEFGNVRYFGLKKPYNFRVAIPFLLGVALLALVLLAVSYTLAFGNAKVGSPRFYFFLYVMLLLCAAIAFSRMPKVSLALIVVCVIELGLASLSTNNISAMLGLADPRLTPGNDPALVQNERFVYHPMLQAKPRPNYSSSSGLNVRHNSLGLRGSEEYSVGEASKTNVVNVYGGSSTYDVGVMDGKTWPEQLQRRLGKRFTVLNFGVPGYSSVEHVIQTAFYSNALNRVPVCAIYYIGWNDIRNAHIPNLDEGYADFHLLAQVDNLQMRPRPVTFSPLLNLGSRYLLRWGDSIPSPPNVWALPPQGGSDKRLEELYKRNIETIVAINQFRKTNAIFIGQVLNPHGLTGDGVYGWLPLVRDRDVWPLQSHFNALLERVATENGAYYIGLHIDSFVDSDFVDNGHFSETGSEKFANLIQNHVRELCSP